MLIQRTISDQILKDLIELKRVVLIYGPRQAGKTTLSKMVIEKTGMKTLMVNADQSKYLDVLSSRDLNQLKSLVSGYELLFIDEGQRVPEIGLNLKILHDELPHLRILVTGSSSFLLSGKVTEAMTGRKKEHHLLPFSMEELLSLFNQYELNDQLNERLVYGNYPVVVAMENTTDKEEYLREISSSYLYKDLFELEQIKFPAKIRELLKLLAYQIGSQVSVHELGNQLKLNRETVERYLYLLEQSFIIFRLSAYSSNLRKEVTKSDKFYFYDIGIRNVIIDNLNLLSNRNDSGQLWENFIVAERKKFLLFHRKYFNSYFWRLYSGTEIDYIEERQGDLFAYEIKYTKGKNKPPKAWHETYGNHFDLITRNNYLDFITTI
ncbi:MAG: ATP-binding protein [Bacteroidetes bacterium]|nr:ATP-binding protein [Bacteroidota bacterium]